jgi:phenylacetate-CoA ligase
MRDFGTEVLACTPSYALVIADTMAAEGVEKSDLKLKSAILGAEPCSEGMRKEIEEKLGCQVYDIYGLSEVMGPGVACECGEQHGLHVNEDKFIIEVVDPETLEPVPDGEHGELFIVGDTVARGYWNRAEQTAAAFHSCPEALAHGMRSYRTGDEMTRDADGQYYYHGRYDLQIKLHGYRIELGDIEATLCALDEVSAACVVPVIRDGAISHLVAVVVPADLDAPRGFDLTKQLKREMRESVPTYMVPRAFKYADELPLNPNGKADRKALAALVNERA